MSGLGQSTPLRGVERNMGLEGPLLGTPKLKHDRSPVTTPDRPRKKMKLEPKFAPSNEVAEQRAMLCSHKVNVMTKLKTDCREHMLELCFLQDMGNIMDFPWWKKKPPSHVYQALRANKLDSDDEDEDLTENNEVKVLTTSRSITPIGTPVALATSLPPLVAAMAQGVGDIDNGVAPKQSSILSSSSQVNGSGTNISNQTSSSSLLTPQSRLAGTAVTSSTGTSLLIIGQRQSAQSSVSGSSLASPQPTASTSALTSPLSSVPQSITGTQEAIVERAKQEAQVMQRVSDLRKKGMWSVRRLPKVQEPARSKAHWDYLLEEMQWLATDFAQERKWKKAGARKIANMIAKYHKEQQLKEQKAEKEESLKTRRIGSALSKMVREFWDNIEKVVEYKQQSRLEEKRKKALDLHLSFIVDQTEKYSTWLTEGLTTKSNSSAGSSPIRDPENDNDFLPSGSDADDEETIAVEEEGDDEANTEQEVEALKLEMDLPIEELLRSLPQEVLDKPAEINASASEESEMDEASTPSPRKAQKRKADDEFDADQESSTDDEDTLDQEEDIEEVNATQANNSMELQELEAEGELPLEELVKKYAGAYDSDFEENMPSDDSGSTSDDSSSTTDSDDSEQPSDEGDDAEEENPEDNWLKELDTAGTSKPSQSQPAEQGPGKELNDIAATARAIQPTGYTLETTKVRTPVPFLLKHTLREYQVVGLDWMATLYESRLNGILADEMGLGKTIQTIALLAHLACEKGVWGPHLIVVPTSVMLNWEVEFKKWCPAFKILTYFGNQKERKAKRTGWTKTNAFHVCITSYKLVIQDHQAFRRKKWKYLVLDEAQNIKNFKSQRWQTLLNFSSQRRLLLTGTPLQNSLMELWSLMHFLMPHVFQSHREFKEWFANPLTGMIEGSREYNDSLIKRLHKVLRPFLLRRLKCDVEKQMPKKYEHVVRCHLSRRQRFLYDDFMSQSKTKETLASGHYMSVINILMQLRKVCNHPNLFDARPIVSPFQMDGISFQTASLVLKALDKDPLQFLRPDELYPNLCDLELRLPAFVACRSKRLQTPRKLIEEIDTTADPEPRLRPLEKPVKLAFKGNSPLPPVSGRSSPFAAVHHRPGSPLTLKSPHMKATDQTLPITTTPSVETTQLHQLPGHTPSITSKPGTPASTPTSIVLSSASTTSATSQPITVQIQNTPEGTRLMIPSGQLSQLPGYIQIVQTPSGQQIIATSQPPPNSTIGAAAMNGPGSTYTTAGITSQVQLPVSCAAQTRPVMRVSPLATAATTTSSVLTSSAGADRSRGHLAAATEVKSVIGTRTSTKAVVSKVKEKSLFFLGEVDEKRQSRRRECLRHISRVNKRHCDAKPVYGQDFCEAVCSLEQTRDTSRSRWHSLGYVHCRRVQVEQGTRRNHPSVFWKQTKALENIVHNPLQYLDELKETLNRFTFVIPPVMAPRITMRTFHPPPSYLNNQRQLESTLHRELAPKAACLHGIATRMHVQFPEARLIQYDCGKLQTLDLLLRRLKSGQHRVLIFTQMTKMLDVLESFLNYHGHRYLRLDGTTKVEQRQLLMERFNADKRIFVFILSTRSGGIGVNLTGADTVVFYDSDWNPTMDAQAQDRCHRIGQTRDVHIYRLISENTIEENILKKANQKRLLGDVAIEGGNFTTAFFKQNTIKELFEEPSGLDALVKEKQEKDRAATAARAGKSESVYTSKEPVPATSSKSILASKEPVPATSSKSEAVAAGVKSEADVKPAESTSSTTPEKSHGMKTRPRPPSSQASGDNMTEEQMEVVLGQAEDDADLQAAEVARAEQKAELAEFDEDIPWDEKEAEMKQCREQEMSRLEKELVMLDKELTPIERYAMTYIEYEVAPARMDELERAEEEVMLAKEEWELGRLKALKEDEERRAEIEDDEMLYTYSREDASAQVKRNNAAAARKNKKPTASRGFGKKLSNRNLVPMGLMDRYEMPVEASVEQIAQVEREEPQIRDVKIELEAAVQAKLREINRRSSLQTERAKIKATQRQHTAVSANNPTPVPVHKVPKVPKVPRQRSPKKSHIQPGYPNSAIIRPPGVRLPKQAHVPALTPPQPHRVLQTKHLQPAVPPPWSNPNLVIRTRKAAIASKEEDTDSDIEVVAVSGPETIPVTQRVIQPVLSKLAANLANVRSAFAAHAPATQVRYVPPSSVPTVSYVRNIQAPGVSLVRGLPAHTVGSQHVARKTQNVSGLNISGLRNIIANANAYRIAGQQNVVSRQKPPSTTATKYIANRTPILEQIAMQLNSPPKIKSITALPAQTAVSSRPQQVQYHYQNVSSSSATQPILVNSQGQRITFNPSIRPVQRTSVVQNSASNAVPISGSILRPATVASNSNINRTILQPSGVKTTSVAQQSQSFQVGNRVIRLQNLQGLSAGQVIQVKTNGGQQQYIQIRQVVPASGGQPQNQTVVLNRPPTTVQHIAPARPRMIRTPVKSSATVVRSLLPQQGLQRIAAMGTANGNPVSLRTPVPRFPGAVNFQPTSNNTVVNRLSNVQLQPHGTVTVVNAIHNPVQILPNTGTVIGQLTKPLPPQPASPTETIVLD